MARPGPGKLPVGDTDESPITGGRSALARDCGRPPPQRQQSQQGVVWVRRCGAF